MILIAWDGRVVESYLQKTIYMFEELGMSEDKLNKKSLPFAVPLLYGPPTLKTFHRLKLNITSNRFCRIMITWHSSWQTPNTMQLRIVTKNNYDCNEIYNPIQCNNTEWIYCSGNIIPTKPIWPILSQISNTIVQGCKNLTRFLILILNSECWITQQLSSKRTCNLPLVTATPPRQKRHLSTVSVYCPR